MCWLPLLPFFICLLFLTELWQGAGEGMTPRSRGQSAVWRVGRDVKMEAWGWQQTSPTGHPCNAVSVLLGTVVPYQGVQTVHSIYIQSWPLPLCAWIWPESFDQKWNPLEVWRDSDLGFWKNLSGRLKFNFELLSAQTLGSIWMQQYLFGSNKIHDNCKCSTLRHIFNVNKEPCSSISILKMEQEYLLSSLLHIVFINFWK